MSWLILLWDLNINLFFLPRSSLHQSLSQEAGLRDQFSSTLHRMEGELEQREGAVAQTRAERDHLMEQLGTLQKERDTMVTKLAQAQDEAKRSEEQTIKLVSR